MEEEKNKKFEFDYSQFPNLDDNSPENAKKTDALIEAVARYYDIDTEKNE